jgi:hypothetical protein
MNRGVPQEVRVTPSQFVDDVVDLLRQAGTPARRRGRLVVVDDAADTAEERRLELIFFLRTWALSHPDLAFEVVEKSA